MSFPALDWAMQQAIPAMQKMVLVSLANRTNLKTGRCFPSIATLAKDSGMTPRSIINQIKKLEQKNLIEVARQEKGVKKPNQYKFTADSAYKKPNLINSAPNSLNSQESSGINSEAVAPNQKKSTFDSEPAALGVVKEMHTNLERLTLKDKQQQQRAVDDDLKNNQILFSKEEHDCINLIQSGKFEDMTGYWSSLAFNPEKFKTVFNKPNSALFGHYQGVKHNQRQGITHGTHSNLSAVDRVRAASERRRAAYEAAL